MGDHEATTKSRTEELTAIATAKKIIGETTGGAVGQSYSFVQVASQLQTRSDLSGDRDTTSTELSAVMDYYGKLKGRCIAKPESYEERKARRTAEIEGLKEALQILESETAFMQRGRHGLRGRHSISL